MNNFDKMIDDMFKGLIDSNNAVNADVEFNGEYEAEIEINGVFIRFATVEGLIEFTKNTAKIKF